MPPNRGTFPKNGGIGPEIVQHGGPGDYGIGPKCPGGDWPVCKSHIRRPGNPKAFRSAPGLSRLYQYKFREYETNRWDLIKNLDLCRMEKRDEPPDWRYPSNVADRVQRLQLRWVTWEELFENLPCSAISEELKSFQEKNGEAP